MMDDSDAFFGSVLHMIQDCAHVSSGYLHGCSMN